MGVRFGKVAPFFYFARTKAIYIYDAWPSDHQLIRDFANNFELDYIFFSSSQAATLFSGYNEKYTCHWVPEGIDPFNYNHLEFSEKDIDVMHFGRRYNWYHSKIKSILEQGGKSYIYKKEHQDVIFPRRKDFFDALARSKISICVPSSITHPDRAGWISTMTLRYLQSMASKCLIVGIVPPEMLELFTYNPVVEIDMENPAEQILDILDNYSGYHSLIEKNYKAVFEDHTWENRWQAIWAKMEH